MLMFRCWLRVKIIFGLYKFLTLLDSSLYFFFILDSLEVVFGSLAKESPFEPYEIQRDFVCFRIE